MKYTTEELKNMKAEELNRVLLREAVYMISEYGGALLFGAIEEEKMEDGWKYYKVDWHNEEDIAYEEHRPDEWTRCDKLTKFSVKKLSRLIRYNYTY